MEKSSRQWIRGSSWTRTKISDPDENDPMASTVRGSLIANTRQEARATLNEPSRPFTPADRHLFSGNDYSNRPPSSYNINSLISQAASEFNASIPTSTSSTGNPPFPSQLPARRKGELPKLEKLPEFGKREPTPKRKK